MEKPKDVKEWKADQFADEIAQLKQLHALASTIEDEDARMFTEGELERSANLAVMGAAIACLEAGFSHLLYHAFLRAKARGDVAGPEYEALENAYRAAKNLEIGVRSFAPFGGSLPDANKDGGREG